MATYSDNFNYPTNDLSANGWIAEDSNGIVRPWYIGANGLTPQDGNTNAGIIHNTGFNLSSDNGVLIMAEYTGMGGDDSSNGIYNSLLLRYRDPTEFLALKIEASTDNYDNRGVYLQPDELGSNGILNYEFPLVNSAGVPLSAEVAPNKTPIPVDGLVKVYMYNDLYQVAMYDHMGSFLASGSINDSSHLYTPYYIGFGHSTDWDANIYGWNGISATDSIYYNEAPIITSFSATSYTIPNGDSSTLGWTVNSGTDATSVVIDNGIGSVGLSGNQIISPSATTTYEISAWNSIGSDTSTVTINVFEELPEIIYFNNSGPVSAGGSATVSWETSSATTAFIDQGIGWLDTSAVSAGSFDDVYNQPTLYNMSAYDDHSNMIVSATTVDVILPPVVNLTISGTPVCSGGDYTLSWDTAYATSAIMNNGIGDVSLPSGSLITSSDVPLSYEISAFNGLGIYTTDSVIANVFYSTPVVDAGPDVSATSIDELATVQFNGSYTFDPQNQTLQYAWYMNGSSAVASTDMIYNTSLSGGTYSLELIATNSCGNSASDITMAYITELYSPSAVAEAMPQVLNELSATTQLDGSSSYDTDGTIVDYKWTLDENLIGTTSTFDYTLLDYGVYDFVLTVTDNDGLSATDNVVVINTESFNPSANAGDDEIYCIPTSSATTDVYLDGSGSLPSDSSSVFNIVWYNWGLSAFGVSDVSGAVSSVYDISANIPNVVMGDYTANLTVSADSTYSDSDSVNIHVNVAPSISGYGEDTVLPEGVSVTNVTLSGYSDAVNPLYMWEIYTGGIVPVTIVGEQFPVVSNLAADTYYANLYVINNDDYCRSETLNIPFTVSASSLSIIELTLNPSHVIGYPSSSVPVDLSWVINNATNAEIDNGIGAVDPVSGTSSLELATGEYIFTLSAYDGSTVVTKSVRGVYETLFTSAGYPVTLSACKKKEKYIKTYDVDEIRYGINREINLVNYLPEYIQETGTVELVDKFQCYLNNIYSGQKNYTIDENLLDINVCQTSSCGISAVDNNYMYDNVSGDVLTSTYDKVGELYIKDICEPDINKCATSLDKAPDVIKELFGNDRISILDKIFRLTDMFDPELIPIELIQFYAENLGYNVGINRESMSYTSDDPRAVEFEQRRYLRFMIRNLPTWYKIKTNRSSIKIMLYSFGLIGTFVYYYTKNYCDVSDTNKIVTDTDVFGHRVKFNCLTDNTGDNNTSGTGDTGGDTLSACNDSGVIRLDNDEITPEDLETLRCCLYATSAVYNTDSYQDAVDKANNDTSDSWVLTRNDSSSVFESLDNPKIRDNYFATPHFRLWIDLLDSEGNFSVDENRQRMIAEAVNTVKPINTVFDGVSVYFDPEVKAVYAASYVRMRKTVKVYASC